MGRTYASQSRDSSILGNSPGVGVLLTDGLSHTPNGLVTSGPSEENDAVSHPIFRPHPNALGRYGFVFLHLRLQPYP